MDVEVVGVDLALWLDALIGPMAPQDLQDCFRARHRVHAEHALVSADFLVLQHDCASYLSRCLTDQLTSLTPEVSIQIIRTAVSAAVAFPLQTAVLSVTDARLGPKEQSGVATAAAAPRWCLVALLSPGDDTGLVEHFRHANHEARITTDEARFTALTVARPVVPVEVKPYGLAPLCGADTGLAIHRAATAARFARYYGLDHLDARHLPSVLSSAGCAKSQWVVDECLAPLRGTRRHSHLLATLRAYLMHNLCVASAARSMYVHRQTFTYRLHRIRELTGLDLARPLDRLRAELALLAQEMGEQGTLPGCGPTI